jgi:hypothetical protein
MAKRIYKTATVYNARITDMRNLWEPSFEYMGKRQERPNYYASFIFNKTRANWFEEPDFANLVQACQALYSEAMSNIPFQQVQWPIKDGDVPDPGKDLAEWRKGLWLLTISSGMPIEVSIIQNGVPVLLKNRVGVKSGDYCGLALSLAVKANDPRGVKCYGNKVMFMSEGEEIVVNNSVSNADLMAQARAQGLNVTGFGGGAPQTGFTVPGGGFAPQPVNPVSPTAPAGFGTAGAGNASFPSSGPQTGFAPSPISPPQQQGFATPGGFTPPTGFPPRQ